MTSALRRARVALVMAAVLVLPRNVAFLWQLQPSLGLVIAGSLGISMAFIVLARLARRHPESGLLAGPPKRLMVARRHPPAARRPPYAASAPALVYRAPDHVRPRPSRPVC